MRLPGPRVSKSDQTWGARFFKTCLRRSRTPYGNSFNSPGSPRGRRSPRAGARVTLGHLAAAPPRSHPCTAPTRVRPRSLLSPALGRARLLRQNAARKATTWPVRSALLLGEGGEKLRTGWNSGGTGSERVRRQEPQSARGVHSQRRAASRSRRENKLPGSMTLRSFWSLPHPDIEKLSPREE
ncbi:uncharacterized protein [Dasypus novemcinctus]|uniref:uncharacterized protein isoform X2 n=1 Tax=Dasypus novemcinctus TaxID=9361 RepID=UPI0039C96921